MSEPYIGQITQIAFTFAPRGYAYCDGTQMQILQNQALFALISNQFGGDGRTNFNLPDLRGRTPVHPDRTSFIQGTAYGSEQVTLTTSQMPAHTHGFVATTTNGQTPLANPAATKILANAVLYGTSEPQLIYGNPTATNLLSLNPNTTTATGGSQPHSNMQPNLVIGFIIALSGFFPSRN